MKNLKRALSVVLSAAMMISLLAVGASAASINDFSDKDEITHTEAVSTLVELGVIAGKDGGVYDPAGIVTRAEMTKMICVVLNGGKDPQLSATSTVSYKDTVGHWAAAYIEYCTNLSIVAGDGTGNFNPNATVTGTQAAKMLLVAMGYKSDIEGFTGSTWATAVDVRANQKGLYDEMNITTSAGLSRDDAAQMVYNAVNANVVDYTYTLVPGSNGQLSSIPTLEDKTVTNNNVTSKITMLEDKFGAVKVEGVVVGNEYATLSDSATYKSTWDNDMFGSAQPDGKTAIRVTNYGAGQSYYGNTAGTQTATFSVSTGADVLGRAVTLYVKPSTTSSTTASKATVLGTAVVNSDNTVVTDYSDDAPNDVLDDNNLDWDSSAVMYTNYASKATNLSTFKTADGTMGQERVFIDNNNDGDVDVVLVNNYALGKVTSYSSTSDGSMTVNFGTQGTVTVDDKTDVVGSADVAKNDYVIGTIAGGKLHVSEAETMTGSLDAYKYSSSLFSALTVDGTKYDVSSQKSYTSSSIYAAAASDTTDLAIDSSATFYLDNSGKIIAFGDADASTVNYAFVKGAADSDGINSDRVKLVLSDGTTKTYDVNDDSALTVDSSKEVINDTNNSNTKDGTEKAYQLVSYTVASDGTVKLSAPKSYDDGSVSDTSFTKNKTAVVGHSDTYYSNSSTVFFYKDASGDVSVYTGYASAPSTDYTTAAVAMNSDGKVLAVYFGGTTATTSGDDQLFLYKWQDNYSDYSTAMAFLPGSSEPTQIKVDSADNSKAADSLYLYTINSDGYYELKTPGVADYKTGVVANDPATTVVISAGEYKVTSDTVAIDNTKNPSTPSATTDDPNCEKGDEVFMIVNTDNEIQMLVKGTYHGAISVVSTATGVVKADDGTFSTDYATVANTPTLTAVKDAITVSDGATFVINTTTAGDLSAAKAAITAGDTAPATLLANTEYYVIVLSADKTNSHVYTLHTANP